MRTFKSFIFALGSLAIVLGAPARVEAQFTPCNDCARWRVCPLGSCYFEAKCCTYYSGAPSTYARCSELANAGWNIERRQYDVSPNGCWVTKPDGRNEDCVGTYCSSGGGGGDECECEPGSSPCNYEDDGSGVPRDGCNCCADNSPLLIDLRGNGYRLSSAAEGVLFDVNGLSNIRWVGWPVDADDSWLAFDRDGNGTIDSGAELFGNAVRLRSGRVARNGYEALAEFDDNGDGLVDSRDTGFSQLRVWSDTNRNGKSEAGELRPLVAVGIAALSTEYRESGRRDRAGNEYRLRAKFFMDNGAQRFSYDVFWTTLPLTGTVQASLRGCGSRRPAIRTDQP